MKRFLAVIAMLGATAVHGALHPPVNLALGRGVLRAVPIEYGPWSGTDLSFEDAVVEELRADDILIRRYERGEELVWLCVVYHQNRRYGAHDPLLCYQSQGYAIAREGRERVPDGTPGGLEVNTFVAERVHQTRVVFYWWTTDGLSTRDVRAFRARMGMRAALDNRSWGAFVRVETIVHGDDFAGARARARDFATRVATTLPGVFSRAVASGAPAP